MSNDSDKSLYERIGGDAAVSATVDLFYKKVLADDRIKHFFENTDMEKQRRHQTRFFTFAFGGPANYNGRAMRAAHGSLVSLKK